LLLSALLPMMATNLSSPFDSILTATDASRKGLGVSEAPLEGRRTAQTLAAHSCFRGDYSCLDSVIPGIASWDPEAPLRLKALQIDTSTLPWFHVLSVPRWDEAHINVAEAEGHLLGLIRRARNSRRVGTRGVYLIDSGAACGAFAKGRSSARLLNRVLRQAAAVRFAAGLRDFYCWVPSDGNPSDLPSRVVGDRVINRRGPQPSPDPDPLAPPAVSQVPPSPAVSSSCPEPAAAVSVSPEPREERPGLKPTFHGDTVFSFSVDDPPSTLPRRARFERSRPKSPGLSAESHDHDFRAPASSLTPAPSRPSVFLLQEERTGNGEEACDLVGWNVKRIEVCPFGDTFRGRGGDGVLRVKEEIEKGPCDLIIVSTLAGTRSASIFPRMVTPRMPGGRRGLGQSDQARVDRENVMTQHISEVLQVGLTRGIPFVWIQPRGSCLWNLPVCQPALEGGDLEIRWVDGCAVGGDAKQPLSLCAPKGTLSPLLHPSPCCRGGHRHARPSDEIPGGLWLVLLRTVHRFLSFRVRRSGPLAILALDSTRQKNCVRI